MQFFPVSILTDGGRLTNSFFSDMGFWDSKRVLVTGGNGFLGRWICHELVNSGVATENIVVPSSSDTDLRNFENCLSVTKDVDVVLHLAGRDGGLGYNMVHPGSIFYDNIIMNLQIMEAARLSNVDKFVTAGTVAAYPENSPIPFVEDEFWNGIPNKDNRAYSMAKKIGVIQAEAYSHEYDFPSVHLLLTNMYGPGDIFTPEKSRVVASLIRKFVDAKKNNDTQIVMWGTGKATRELLYVEDAARAFILAAEKCNTCVPINVGSGVETSIREMADTIAEIVEYSGTIIWDSTKPEGQLRRCSDVSRAYNEFGFKANVGIRDGLKKTVEWYLNSL